ncbi:MAG TPA: DUF885 domain-containing protein [Terriglobales bacterium]|nr:DUF885 domain-containing protein [Terriglobales bacterium]
MNFRAREIPQAAVLLLIAMLFATVASAHEVEAASKNAATAPDWIKRSNENAKVLLDVMARFGPEGAARLGVEGYDEQVMDLKPGVNQRMRQASLDAADELKKRLAAEKDPLVGQDLEILIKAAMDNARGVELSEKYEIPYFNVPEMMFFSFRGLLDDRVAPERRQKALVRLKRYVGAGEGYTPLTTLAQDRTRERMTRPGVMGPIKAELEKGLSNESFFIEGIGQLFEKFKIAGYEESYAKLKEQLTSYNAFVRKDLLPRARTDFRLPAEMYAFNLDQYGGDVPPADLAAKAHAAFDATQKEMQALAAQIAKQKGYKRTDYRNVILELRKEQLVGEAILPHYHERLKQIEQIIRRERLVSLPQRAARIRLATAAESAAIPAPHLNPPRMLGNTGEQADFVLPLNIPAPAGSKESTQKMDDWTCAAASWTLTAHEARPGHELQFAAMIERGVSAARAIFAFNSTNVEGWGLYAEHITRPFMPLEGQLISLQARLQRAARAFLDPELQAGKVTPEQAFKVLRQDVVLSEAMANQEVERYTFRAPGQATAYFYGYTRLLELRGDVEKALEKKFNQQKFHDFILSEGMLPPHLLRKAVFNEFVPHIQQAKN